MVTILDKSSATVCREYRYIVKRIETETDLKIKYLRTDCGREYEGDLTPVLKELGVKHETTSPDSPQSNGKAERLNRTLEEHARAMLYQANMPKSFWAEAITTAAYVLNRLPSDAVNGIPYELWHNKPLTSADLTALKPFGCIVHACVPKKRQKKRGKTDTRSHYGCFIEYTDTNTMHKIWNFERKRFEKSHDLRFEETQFPRPNDFDEPPADSYNPQSPSPTPSPEPESMSEPDTRPSPQIFEQIDHLLHYESSKLMENFILTMILPPLQTPCVDLMLIYGGKHSVTK